jgi:hypothetical protein
MNSTSQDVNKYKAYYTPIKVALIALKLHTESIDNKKVDFLFSLILSVDTDY